MESANLADLNERFRPVPEDYEGRISDELKTTMEFPGFTADNMSKFKERYVAMALIRITSNTAGSERMVSGPLPFRNQLRSIRVSCLRSI